MKHLNNTPNGLSREEVENILRPYYSDLYDSIVDGWTAWEELGKREPGLRKPLNSWARASFVYCHIVDSAKRRFQGNPEVHLSEKRRFLVMTFKGQVVLRFKKLDSRRRARGAPTRQFKLFMAQQSLPGLEFAQKNVVTGYRLDELQTQIKDILIVCPKGAHNEWHLDVPLETSAIEKISPPTTEDKPSIRPVAVRKEESKSG